MLQRMEEIDGIVLACRERMMEQTGNDSMNYMRLLKDVALCSWRGSEKNHMDVEWHEYTDENLTV